jgi:hypothetical protein
MRFEYMAECCYSGEMNVASVVAQFSGRWRRWRWKAHGPHIDVVHARVCHEQSPNSPSRHFHRHTAAPHSTSRPT